MRILRDQSLGEEFIEELLKKQSGTGQPSEEVNFQMEELRALIRDQEGQIELLTGQMAAHGEGVEEPAQRDGEM